MMLRHGMTDSPVEELTQMPRFYESVLEERDVERP
jgi:hypothetical protein